jgi:signal transduction histidine kinase
MRLAAKLISLLIACILLVLTVDTYFFIRNEQRDRAAEIKRESMLLGEALRPLVVDVWTAKGEARVRALIRDVNEGEHQVAVRLVRLDGHGDSTQFPNVLFKKLSSVTRGKVATVNERTENGEYLYCYFPLPVPGDNIHALELAQSLDPMQMVVRTATRRSALVAALIAAVGAALVAVIGVRFIGVPVGLLADKFTKTGTGDFSGPVRLKGHDELAKLAQGVNEMCHNLEEARRRVQAETNARVAALNQLRHKERLATVGRLASGVAHELGTPLNVISGRAGMIMDDSLPREDTIRYADIIRKQCHSMTTIIRQLLDFARKRPAGTSTIDIRGTVQQAIALVDSVANKHNVQLALKEEGKRATVKVDAAQIQQVIMNLLMNAIQAMPKGGHVDVSVTASHAAPPGDLNHPGRYVRIAVHDQGEGIRPEDITHIFEPFFTTKDVGEGTGLGLSIAYGIVSEHGGWIEAESDVGEGSCFTVYLPSEDQDARTNSHCG